MHRQKRRDDKQKSCSERPKQYFCDIEAYSLLDVSLLILFRKNSIFRHIQRCAFLCFYEAVIVPLLCNSDILLLSFFFRETFQKLRAKYLKLRKQQMAQLKTNLKKAGVPNTLPGFTKKEWKNKRGRSRVNFYLLYFLYYFSFR